MALSVVKKFLITRSTLSRDIHNTDDKNFHTKLMALRTDLMGRCFITTNENCTNKTPATPTPGFLWSVAGDREKHNVYRVNGMDGRQESAQSIQNKKLLRPVPLGDCSNHVVLPPPNYLIRRHPRFLHVIEREIDLLIQAHNLAYIMPTRAYL